MLAEAYAQTNRHTELIARILLKAHARMFLLRLRMFTKSCAHIYILKLWVFMESRPQTIPQ